MFRLSRGGQYAVDALICLAATEGDGYTLTTEMARRQGAPPKYLAKIFQKLVKAQILKSSRGAGGGVALAMPSDEITIRQIVEAVEGPIELTRCRQCRMYQTCSVCKIWSEIELSMLNALSEVNLKQLSRSADPGCDE